MSNYDQEDMKEYRLLFLALWDASIYVFIHTQNTRRGYFPVYVRLNMFRLSYSIIKFKEWQILN